MAVPQGVTGLRGLKRQLSSGDGGSSDESVSTPKRLKESLNLSDTCELISNILLKKNSHSNSSGIEASAFWK